MNKKMHLGLRLLAGVALAFAAHAQAAEITFYEYGGFVGRSLTLRGQAANFAEIGFNDRAASIVVRSGNWQVCTDANFGGTCATLTLGEYRALDGRFDSKISSAQETSYAGQTGGYTNYRRGAVELFEGPNFSGASIMIDQDSANFARSGFNDRAASMIVHDGTWDICVAPNYQGSCRTYTRGRYADLGRGMAQRASSARIVGGYADAPYVIGGDGGAPQLPGSGGIVGLGGVAPVQNGRIILYDADGYTGRSMAVVENIVDLTNTSFNDQAASLLIESGTWELCTDPYFRGQCRMFGPGMMRRLEPAIYRAISSMRLVGGSVVGAKPGFVPGGRGRYENRVDIELFEHANFEGRRLSTRNSVADLYTENFNDITSSIVVYAGQWELCTDANFGGRCVVFGPGKHANMFGLNDSFSSLRRIDR
jgi:Beta/Gamma crystallin